MKKIVALISLGIFILVPHQLYAQSEVACPKLENLQETTIKDKDDLLKKLKQIVDQTYVEGEYGHMYSEWELRTALPFLETIGREQEGIYYEMAKNFCSQEVADKSWLVRLYFLKWEGLSASALEGQIFLAKNKEDRWFVWFRYH
ncbi:hypothetical protein [Gracilibacillus thailandensis]|uniref:Uncharacterized protein n=1 Tax=Gracilibacillus thailandensis TaxID=563735 RepID=A0A6N7QXL6_9BACI|nr:hypothetical protein [Gracilibacillus thailandensis]MRI66758.1 hypothetical protein [Gracilibacillus thailandensis]